MIFPKVSVIIPNWNGLQDTIECLESLKKITYPNYHVVVVDNGSKRNDAATCLGSIIAQTFVQMIRIGF